MIRIQYADLESKIEERLPKWYSSTANERWKVLKPLLLELQHGKCSFCERYLGTIKDSVTQASHGYEKAVEHYRPKGTVRSWSPPENWPEQLPPFDSWEPGYEWLQFEPMNFSVSCLTCNQTYKGSYFPIRGPLSQEQYQSMPSPVLLEQENPYLIFPVENGDLPGADPERLISFEGWNPIPHPRLDFGSHDYWRARVTIELLGLRNEFLAKERQERIVNLAQHWALTEHWSLNTDWVEKEHSKHPHANCTRRYLEACRKMPQVAKSIALEACEALDDQQARKIIARFWSS